MEQHWSKDYIEHLRTAHFALIFLCTAGIIIALAPGKPEVSPARQQLDQIRNLVANWDPYFLQAPAQDDSQMTLVPASGKFTLGGQTLKLNLKVEQPISFVTLNKESKLSLRTNCDAQPGPNEYLNLTRVGDVADTPKTVQEFQDLWDALFDGVTLHRPSWVMSPVFFSQQAVPHGPLQKAQVHGINSKPAKAQTVTLGIQCIIAKSRADMRQLDDEFAAPYEFYGELDVTKGLYDLHFPVYLDDRALDGQAQLFRNRNQTWHYGHFNESFRELNEALSHEDLKSLTWQRAVGVLTEQEQRMPSESFEAFGMKLPATASAYGALIMILGLQWYLWAQIYEFRRKLKDRDEVTDAAWISIYTSLPARTLTIASMFILPVFAVAVLGLRGAHSHVLEAFSWPVSILGLCLSAALAIATGFATPRTATVKV